MEAVAPRATQPVEDGRLPLGELGIQAEADPWRFRILDPSGRVFLEMLAEEPLGFWTRDSGRHTATRLVRSEGLPGGGARWVLATDDPAGRTIAVSAEVVRDRVLRLSIGISNTGGVIAVGGAWSAAVDERFVGLGERFAGVNQRGRVVESWAEDRVVAGHGESTYAPLPLLLSSRGYGFALERFERSRFSLAVDRPDRWSWRQESSAAACLISYGPGLKDLVQRNAEVAGLPPLPPLWAFGSWKTATGGQDEVLDEARRLREMSVPVSAFFVYDAVDDEADVGWPTVNFAGRHAGPYPDHAAFTSGLHGLGYKAINYVGPDFHVGRPNYAEPAARGLLVRREDGSPYVHQGFQISWLDFTNPATVAWWGTRWQRALAGLGYDGGMLDLGELLPEDAHFADGTTGAETHNRYPLLYAQAAWQGAAAARPDGDFVLFVRSGALGAQRFQSLQWPGDTRMVWGAPDGLRSMIPAALSFGLSGFPYWHAEVAGYVQAGLAHDQERELWLRWLQFATWTATLRDHYGDHPSAPVDFWLDEGTVEAYREAARIHNSLVPYLYTCAREASQTGLPLIRFLPLEVTDDPRAWDQEQSYFLGPLLLVAPVVEAGATSRTVYLPKGRWVDFWTNDVHAGEQEIVVPSPVVGGHAPVFLRAGAVLPLAADFDSLVPANAPNVRTYSGDLRVRVAPGPQTAESAFTLYDGTHLAWNGTSLTIEGNPRPRTVTLEPPDRPPVTQRIEGDRGRLSTP